VHQVGLFFWSCGLARVRKWPILINHTFPGSRLTYYVSLGRSTQIPEIICEAAATLRKVALCAFFDERQNTAKAK